MQERFLGLPLLIWALIALLIAALFAFVIPNSKITANTTGIQLFALRWLHPLVWVFLSLLCLFRAQILPGGNELANISGLLALGSYLSYVFFLLRA